MSKTLLCLFVIVCSINAATIITHAFCPGTGDVFGSTSVRCPPFSSTSAGIAADPFYEDSVSILAASSGPVPHHEDGSFASATFIDDYVLTITGGTGQGFFAPCLFAGAMFIGTQTIDSASFGSASVNTGMGDRVGTCASGLNQYIAFTFDVPQTFTVSLSSLTGAGSGSASLTGLQFMTALPPFKPLNDAHFTLVSVDLPEPSAWSLLPVGVMFFLVVAIAARSGRSKP